MRYLRGLTAVFLVMCAHASFAQQTMTLEDAIGIGLKNNYDILLAKNQSEVASNDYHYAFGAFLPNLSATASKNWSVTDINQKFSNGQKQERNGSKSNTVSAAANLNWTLFDGLRVFAAKQRMETIMQEGKLTVKQQVENSVSQIIQAYYNIVQEEQQLQSLNEQMAISQQRVTIARNKFESGLGSKIDFLQAQVNLNAQKAAFLKQQTVIEQSKGILSQLISLPQGQTFAVVDSIPINRNLDITSLQHQVFNNNFGLQLAQKNILISELSRKELLRSRMPTISFNSSYSFSRNNSQAGFFLFNQSKGLQYGFSASIPIFQQFNLSRQLEDARLNIDYEKLNLENLKSQVSLNLQNAFKNYQYALQALDLEEENIGVAKENVQVALASFKQGQITSLDVQVAQQALADAEARLIGDRFNAKVAETTLMQLNGQLMQ